MRLKKFVGFLSLATLLLTFTACSDDDDEFGQEPSIEIPLAAYVEGTYVCHVDMAFAYGALEYDDKVVTITANSDNANYIDIAFSDEALGTLNGAIGIELIDNNNNSYSFSTFDDNGNEIVACLLSMPTHSGGTSDYACLVSGTISEDHNTFNIVFNMPGVMGGTTYTFTPTN